MGKSIDEFLKQMRRELSGCDPATVQDALADAEEYLRNGVDQLRKGTPDLGDSDALSRVVEEYGTAAEVAAAYKEIETRVVPSFAPPEEANGRSFGARFFGVFIDPRAYASLFYMFFSLATGIFYFVWVTTGLSLSVGLIVLIIGLPFFALFLLSVRGIALVEGRIVEALLGVRMPRRPLFSKKHLGAWGRFVALFTDSRSWFAVVYMFLQLPLGVFYFSLFTTLVAFGLAGIAHPITQYGFGLPFGHFGHTAYYVPVWLTPFVVLAGVLWILITMHLAKFVGRYHGALAKVMLVRE